MSEQRAGRGEGLAGLVARVLDEHRRVDGLDGRTCACGWQADKVNPKAYDWQHRLHVGEVISALEAAAPPSTAATDSFARGFAKALDRVHYHFHDFEKGEDACKPLHTAFKKAEADLATLASPSTLATCIKALPSIKDEHGDECVSRAVVLALLDSDCDWEEREHKLRAALATPSPQPPPMRKAALSEIPGWMLNDGITEMEVEVRGSPRKVGEDGPRHITIDYAAKALEAAGKSYSIRDAQTVARTLNALLARSVPVGEPPELPCICAQGVTKCPQHGEQPARRGLCPKCGAVLGYCAAGQYCTKEECKYVS